MLLRGLIDIRQLFLQIYGPYNMVNTIYYSCSQKLITIAHLQPQNASSSDNFNHLRHVEIGTGSNPQINERIWSKLIPTSSLSTTQLLLVIKFTNNKTCNPNVVRLYKVCINYTVLVFYTEFLPLCCFSFRRTQKLNSRGQICRLFTTYGFFQRFSSYQWEALLSIYGRLGGGIFDLESLNYSVIDVCHIADHTQQPTRFSFRLHKFSTNPRA